MENVTVITTEIREYIAPEGKVFKKVSTFLDENGELQEEISYYSRLKGASIDIADYTLAPEEEYREWQRAQEVERPGEFAG